MLRVRWTQPRLVLSSRGGQQSKFAQREPEDEDNVRKEAILCLTTPFHVRAMKVAAILR